MTTKITFLLPVPSHARYHKRVSALERLGVRPAILSFEREYYAGRPWAAGYQSLGGVQNRTYPQRLLTVLKAMPLVRAASKNSRAVYAFGLDTLLLGWLASRT